MIMEILEAERDDGQRLRVHVSTKVLQRVAKRSPPSLLQNVL
jgi:hypothetical protein